MHTMNNQSQLIIYTAPDGQTKVEVRLVDETVWLNQAQMAVLFQRDKSVVSRHIANVFAEGELDKSSVVAKYATTGSDNKTYEVEYYNLDIIISVGYRVKSHRGTQFRIWATKQLRELIVKGFVMDDVRLTEGDRAAGSGYFEELIERIRAIRSSEKNFYAKVRDVFATSVDYESGSEYAQNFYATVQNKFHYAITGNTAAEIVVGRIGSSKENLGLTNWGGSIITRKQAEVAKNYLEELELRRLNLLVEQFLSFAELQSVERRPMYMKTWQDKLDGFLLLNEKKILQNAGSVSRGDMEEKVRLELANYNQKTIG